MAGNESTPGSLAEDSLSTRLQWLRQRREALQEKLAQKNNELKNLCVEEAELTGVLPPEIPLEPGESPPVFRKKVGTTFTYPQNLINKLKTNEVVCFAKFQEIIIYTIEDNYILNNQNKTQVIYFVFFLGGICIRVGTTSSNWYSRSCFRNCK